MIVMSNPVLKFVDNYDGTPTQSTSREVPGEGYSLLNEMIRNKLSNDKHIKFVERLENHQFKEVVEELLSKKELSKMVKDMHLEPESSQSKEWLGLQLYFTQEAFKEAIRYKVEQKFNISVLKKLEPKLVDTLDKCCDEAFTDIFQVQSVYGNPNEVRLHIDFESKLQAPVELTEAEAFRPFLTNKELVFSVPKDNNLEAQDTLIFSSEDVLVPQSFATDNPI